VKKIILTLILLSLLLRTSFATIGLGLSPSNYKINFLDGGNVNYRDINVLLTNNGNTEIFINASGKGLNVDFSENNFKFKECSCEGYCDKNVVECSELYPPKTFKIRVYNPYYNNKTAEIIFQGSQLSNEGQMVKTGVSAKMKLELSNIAISTTTIKLITTTTHQNNPTTTTTQSGGIGGINGTTTTTKTTVTTTTIRSGIYVNYPPLDNNPSPTTTITEQFKQEEQQPTAEEPAKFSLIHFFFNTPAGMGIITVAVIILVVGTVFYIQKKKTLVDNPFSREDNQGINY
jgi:hypothetical protein